MADRIEILLSTMDDRLEKLALDPADLPAVHVHIVHQTTGDAPPRDLFADLPNVTLHHRPGQRGLSASRNAAIEAARGDICLFSDDDVTYRPNLADTLSLAFADNPDADIITFQAVSPEGTPLKRYPRKRLVLTRWNATRVSSIELAFRRRSVQQDPGLRFDTRFGLGAPYGTGEEYIFLADAMKKGLKTIHLPVVIVTHPLESSGKRHDEKTVVARGAMMARVFGRFAYLLDILFALKKYREYRKALSFSRYLLLLWRGGRELLREGHLLS